MHKIGRVGRSGGLWNGPGRQRRNGDVIQALDVFGASGFSGGIVGVCRVGQHVVGFSIWDTHGDGLGLTPTDQSGGTPLLLSSRKPPRWSTHG
jgi:hypothetical protein